LQNHAFALELLVRLNKPSDQCSWQHVQPLLHGQPTWHRAEDMVEQIVPCVYCGGVTIMAIKHLKMDKHTISVWQHSSLHMALA
jgi:hypothetical protein